MKQISNDEWKDDKDLQRDVVGQLDPKIQVREFKDDGGRFELLFELHSPGFQGKSRRVVFLSNRKNLLALANQIRRELQPSTEDEILATLERIEKQLSES